MGFLRFRRSVRLFPGVRLNFSRRGISTSIGGRGAHVTIGHGQVRETVGIPGTGVSYTEQHSYHHPDHRVQVSQPTQSRSGAPFLLAIAIVVLVVWVLAHFAT